MKFCFFLLSTLLIFPHSSCCYRETSNRCALGSSSSFRISSEAAYNHNLIKIHRFIVIPSLKLLRFLFPLLAWLLLWIQLIFGGLFFCRIFLHLFFLSFCHAFP